MGLKTLKIVGFALTGIGAIVSIFSSHVSDKILDHTIEEKVAKAIAEK